MTVMLRQLLIVCIVAPLTLCACQNGQHYDGQRTQEQTATYRALNDSMQHLVSSVLPAIRQQMKAALAAGDSLSYYDYLLMYGRHYLLSEKPDSIVPYINRTLAYVNSITSPTPRTRGLAAMANSSKASYHYLLYHNTDTVIGLYQRAYSLMQQSDMEDNLPDLCANLGDAYVQKGDVLQASHWYRRALVLVDSLGLPTQRNITLYMGLGRIYTTLRDFERASEYYEMADEKFDEMKPNMQSYFINNYGNYFYYKREFPKALQMFKRLKKHLEQYNATENFDMYLCKINLADVYLNLGMPDSARLYVEPAEAYFEQQGVDIGVYYAHTIRIGIAMKEKRFDDVRRILTEEGSMVVSDPNIKAIRDQYLNQYYAAIGNFQAAYERLSVGKNISDSTEDQLRSMRSSDIMSRLAEDTIRLHHQLMMNEKEAVYTRTRTAFWMILSLLIIVVLLFVVWFSQERKRLLQQHLDLMTLRMANTRQRISPHFVFNVLNARMSKSDQQEADQLVSLAKLIRTNLDMTSQTYITLAQELDFVQQYIDVEKGLLGETFSYELIAPDRSELEEIQIPSMLVQILVENAIIHGLKPIQGDKHLTIEVSTDKHETHIEVIDNGPGFDVCRIGNDQLRTGMNIIRNTIATINQQNKRHKMEFRIHNDNGCHATLIIPKNITFIYPTPRKV